MSVFFFFSVSFLYTAYPQSLLVAMLMYNSVNSFSVNIHLAANHINMYTLLGLFTFRTIIQWVGIMFWRGSRQTIWAVVQNGEHPTLYVPLNWGLTFFFFPFFFPWPVMIFKINSYTLTSGKIRIVPERTLYLTHCEVFIFFIFYYFALTSFIKHAVTLGAWNASFGNVD